MCSKLLSVTFGPLIIAVQPLEAAIACPYYSSSTMKSKKVVCALGKDVTYMRPRELCAAECEELQRQAAPGSRQP